MYYYIFEQAKSSHEKASFEKIRDIAREYSISGENTQSSAARTPEELVKIAIEKNYSTIIAIGNDSHINRIVSAIINESPLYSVALGIICTEPESILYERWGFKTAEEACETLKFRKLERFTAGLVEPNHYFLSSARIECPRPSRVIIEIDHFKVEAVLDRIEISNNLYILLERFIKDGSIIKSAFNWLVGKDAGSADRSVFKGKVIKISSVDPLPVFIGNSQIKKTPINVYRKLNALNIITKRDKLIREKEADEADNSKSDKFWEHK